MVVTKGSESVSYFSFNCVSSLNVFKKFCNRGRNTRIEPRKRATVGTAQHQNRKGRRGEGGKGK